MRCLITFLPREIASISEDWVYPTLCGWGQSLLSWWLNTCHYTDKSIHSPLLFHNSDMCTAESSLDPLHPGTQIRWLQLGTILWCQICEFCIFYSISCHFMHYLASRSVMVHLGIMYMLLLLYAKNMFIITQRPSLSVFSFSFFCDFFHMAKWTDKNKPKTYDNY